MPLENIKLSFNSFIYDQERKKKKPFNRTPKIDMFE